MLTTGGGSLASQRLGVQAHCLRFEIQRGLEPALEEVRRLGLAAIELVYLPGCRGNWWGDFGATADRSPRDIAQAIAAAGLECPSVMASPQDLCDERIAGTLDWVAGTGAPVLSLASFAKPAPGTSRNWSAEFDSLDRLADRVASAGLSFALHTSPELWAPVEGRRPCDDLLRRLDPRRCRVVFDPAGAIIHGEDPARFLQLRPDAFFALHLRDGYQPPEPVFYLASEAVGAGEIDWDALIVAAAATSLQWYFLEMEVPRPDETLAALRQSIDYLHTRRLLQPDAGAGSRATTTGLPTSRSRA
ncbi:MAG: sugar phosphate isomerase/epimerase [Steroidobacteraceae bacterium]